MSESIRKPTPIAKIYEALSAIADERVKIYHSENLAHVISSDYSKAYTVKIGKGVYSSNDNATYWQHYAGYPIVAVLMVIGKLPIPAKYQGLLKDFRKVNWKALNTQYKNKYDQAVLSFLGTQKDALPIQELVIKLKSELDQLDFQVKRNREPMIVM